MNRAYQVRHRASIMNDHKRHLIDRDETGAARRDKRGRIMMSVAWPRLAHNQLKDGTYVNPERHTPVKRQLRERLARGVGPRRRRN